MTATEVPTTALIPSCNIDQILAERDAIVRAADTVHAALLAAPDGFPRLSFLERGNNTEWDPAKVKKMADRQAWSELIHKSGLWTFMDHRAREEWRNQLDNADRYHQSPEIPPFTRENAQSTIDSLHEQRGPMVARGVAETFRRLSGHYKTNRPDAFGKRMILTYVLSTYGYGKSLSHCVNHRACDDLDDLTRSLCILRGLPEPDHRTGAWHILNRREEAHRSDAWPRDVEFDYFTIRLFKNGNGHLTFKHEADVMRLNKVLSIASGGLALANDTRNNR